MRYTLRQLQIFLAVAHYQNITRAADFLAMSQSAASSALKELESQYQIQLFDRVGKRLQLNEQGRLLRPRVEALLAQAEGLDLTLSQHVAAGSIKVGATLTIGHYLAVRYMVKLMQLYPEAQVNLSVANTQSITQQVLNFELDIGMIEGELQHSELQVIPWLDDELVVFAAPDHPLSQKTHITDDDLLKAQWILREKGSGTRQTFERAMHGILPALNVVLELQHTEAIKRAVEAGVGIGCLSQVALADAFKRGSLKRLPVYHRQFDRKFYFILHQQKYRSAGIERWLTLCQEAP